MKLTEDFYTHETDGEQIMVAAGNCVFAGVAHNNRTASFIVNLLKEECTKDGIVDAVYEKYNAPRTVIETDVEQTLKTLREIGALEE